MEFSIKSGTVKSGWSIVYIIYCQDGPFYILYIVFLSLKINLVLANSACGILQLSSGSSLVAKVSSSYLKLPLKNGQNKALNDRW